MVMAVFEPFPVDTYVNVWKFSILWFVEKISGIRVVERGRKKLFSSTIAVSLKVTP